MKVDLYHFQQWQGINYPNDAVSRLERMKYVMHEMLLAVQSAGARLVIVYLSFFGKNQAEPPPDDLINSLQDDIIFVDLTSSVNEYYESENNPTLALPADYHPGVHGHALIARELEDVLRQERLLSSLQQ